MPAARCEIGGCSGGIEVMGGQRFGAILPVVADERRLVGPLNGVRAGDVGQCEHDNSPSVK